MLDKKSLLNSEMSELMTLGQRIPRAANLATYDLKAFHYKAEVFI